MERLREIADRIWEFRGQVLFGAILGVALAALVGCVL
jgi:hypothetical protein